MIQIQRSTSDQYLANEYTCFKANKQHTLYIMHASFINVY